MILRKMKLRTKEKNLKIYEEGNKQMQRWLPVDKKFVTFKCVPGYEFYEELMEGDD